MTAISEILYQGPLITKASKAVILLHGRGGRAKNILSLADRLCHADVSIAAPQATHNAWYPYSFLEEEKKNEPSLSASIAAIHDLIEKTAEHLPKENIYP